MVAVPLESLPLGFRFHPTDEELVNHYLKGKIGGRKPQVDLVIPEIDVCKCEPWDLPDKSIIKNGDPEWFFFAPRDRKYPNGHRSNRATEAGYWKATGKDRKIKSRALAGSALIGMKKTLVFYRGRAPKGERTGWIMHEYRTVDGNTDGATGDQGAYVLCRLFKKQEEKPLNSNYDEIDETALTPLQSKSSPDETPVVPEQEDESEKEIVQEVKMQDMQQSKQLSSIEEQPDVSSWLTDGVDTGMYPAKPEDSYSNSNMASDVVGLEIELGKMHEDDICWPLEQVDSANYPLPLSPMPLVESHVYGNFNHQMGLLPGDNTEPDYITEFLDSVLSNQDENLGNSVDQKDFNGDAFIDKQVDVYASDVPQSYHLLGNADNMLLTNNLENDERLCQAQADLGSNPPICQNSDYPMDSVYDLQAGAAFYTKASIDVYSPDSLQELSGIPEMAIMSNADNTSYGNTENSLVGAEIQIKRGRRQHVSSSISNRQGIAVRRIRLQKELHVGSSLCSVSSSTTESYRNQANPVVKKDEQVLKPEESSGSANVDEMGSSDHDEDLSAEKTPDSKEVIESMPASTPRKSGSDSQHKDIAVPQTVDQKFMAVKDEGLSAERSPDSKKAVIESMPTLRLRKSNSALQHKVMEVTQTADQKFKYAKRGSLLTYMALGAVVAASIVGISVYFRL